MRALATATVVVALLLLAAIPAGAVEPGEMLADPALEARARAISKELRCLVCQNQSIDESNARLARDLRIIVRDRLKAGDSDAAVIAFVTARYGDFVLLRPPFKATTWLLWLGPLVVFVAGTAGVWLHFRRRRRTVAQVTPLSEDEERRIARLMEDGSGP